VKRTERRGETALAGVIGRALEEEGLGVRGLARESGVSPAQLSRILGGQTRRPSAETLARLAKALQRDPAALLVVAEPELTGQRLATARLQLLEAIDGLGAEGRETLAAERRELRRQSDQVDDLTAEIGELQTRLAERPGGREAGRLQERLQSLTSRLDALDGEFGGAVRAAAARLFAERRAPEVDLTDQLRLSLHQSRAVRAVAQTTATPRRSRAPDRGLRQLMRIWDQLDAKRRRRVFEYAEDQLRLSQHGPDEQK
jgi:transcriptional regulator with XRE-family HTH domain